MKRAIWTVRRAAHACGRRGLAGIALAVIAIVIGSGLRMERAAQDEALLQANTRAATLQREVATRRQPAAQAALPAASTYTDFLRMHATMATERSIALTEIDYSSRAEADQRLLRHTLRYTIDGPYPALRDFLSTVEQLPGVRVESMSMLRAHGDSAVNALVQLSYLVESGS